MAGKKEFPLKVVIGAVDKVTAPMLRMQRGINRFMRPFKGLQKSVDRFTRAAGFRAMGLGIRRATGATMRLGKEVGKLGLKLAGLAGVAAGLVTNLVVGFGKAGDNVAKTAKRLGVGTEWLQEMRFAAERSGIEMATFDMAVQRAGRRIGQFISTGKGEAADVLRGFGFTREQVSNLGGVEAILPIIADKLRQIRDPMVRNALAMKLFDSEGVKMVQLLDEGSEGMARLQKQARELGLVISDEDAKAAEQFTDRLSNLQAALTGVRNIIGSALLPVVQELAVKFTQFIVDNREQFTQWVRALVSAIPPFDELKAGAERLLDRLKPLFNFVVWMADNIGILKTALIALAAVMGGKVLVALIAVIPAIKALGVALLTTPVGWFMAAIAAIAGGAALIIKNWDGITEWFTKKFDGIKRVLGRFKDFFGFGDEELTVTGGPAIGAAGALSGGNGQQQARVQVDFANLPAGARVTADPRSTADLDLSQGYSLMPGGA